MADRVGGRVAYCLKCDDDWYVHEGDPLVSDDLDLDVALVADGDLLVHGFLDDYVSAIGTLVVLGNLVVAAHSASVRSVGYRRSRIPLSAAFPNR